MKQFLLFVIIVLSFIFVSCHQDSTGPSDSRQSSSAYFPNSVGSQWKYSIFDKHNSLYDTLRVTIVGSSTMPNGKKVTLWRYATSEMIDMVYYYSANDTVEIYKSVLFLDSRLLFPLSVGKSWNAIGTTKISDSIVVTRDSVFKDLRSDGPKGYCLERNWGGLNDYGVATYWFVPGIGIVVQDIREWGFNISNKNYKLISYDIK